jgi:hypothetical protein
MFFASPLHNASAQTKTTGTISSSTTTTAIFTEKVQFAPVKYLTKHSDGTYSLKTNSINSSSNLSSNVTSSVIQPNSTPTALGTLKCYASGMKIVCNWSIQVNGGDLINSSNVAIDYYWIDEGDQISAGENKFTYRVNPPVPQINDQGEESEPYTGEYQAKLGGTFTTVENGTWGAFANQPSTVYLGLN